MNVRHTDFALFRRRLEKFDFDMVTIRVGDFTLPNTADLKSEYGSESADVEGSNNYRGLKSRAVDGVLAAMEKATTMDQLRDAARALDRIVMHECWQVPDLYLGANRVSRWDKLGIPKTIPKFYQISTPSDWMQWGVNAWWTKSGAAP
jgi:peptide/nickel transport system substrate-binding protein/microcin C transport system substrate-binding protein